MAIKTKEVTLEANMKQFAMVRALQDEEYREVHEAIEHMNERQEELMFLIERKQKLKGEVPELMEKMPRN